MIPTYFRRENISRISFVLCFFLFVIPADAQQTNLRIISPVEGTRYKPGETITVEIDISRPEELDQVLVTVGNVPAQYPSARRIAHQTSIPMNAPRGGLTTTPLAEVKPRGAKRDTVLPQSLLMTAGKELHDSR